MNFGGNQIRLRLDRRNGVSIRFILADTKFSFSVK